MGVSWKLCTFMVLCLLHHTYTHPTSTLSSVVVTTAPSSTSTQSETVEVRSEPTDGTTKEASSTTAASPASPTSPTTSTSEPDVRYQPKITSMHVESNVTLRYAKTLVTSKVSNPDSRANEVTFSVVIPETAFITAFSMEIDGKVYDAYVKEKDEAKKEYQTAVSSGISAAHVAVKARDSNHFTVSVNVEPQKKAIFRLYYEELLSRRLGLYNLVMNLSPGQLVEDFAVDVDITETAPITAVYVPSLRTGNEVDADPSDAPNEYAKQTISEDRLSAKVHFAPTKAQQLELMKTFKEREKPTPPTINYFNPVERPKPTSDEEGVKGQFVVQYDVDREVKNEVMLNDGYFVHFFAPGSLKPLNKHVIFVLDVSGSMAGRKINQLKEAMTSILEDLNPGDYFSILSFHYSAKVYNLKDPSKHAVFRSSSNNYMYPWDDDEEKSETQTLPPPYPATKENVDAAKEIIKSLDASGGTNIHDALTTALKVANTGIQVSKMTPESDNENRLPEPIVIFLTDGDPTVGETNPDHILKTVKTDNPKNVAIFSLAFGEDADRSFLRRVALQNSGFLRHIYEAADAAQQLRHFYKLVASPLLSNVTFTYPKDQIDENTLTKKKFDYYFMGSELVVAGKLADKENADLPVKLHANAYTGPIDFIPNVLPEAKRTTFWPLERMWAYISIKQLLDEKDEKGGKAEDLTDPDSPAKKALDLALKYSFVTPLTSLVVVKPNSTAAVDAESVDASGADANSGFALPLIAGGASGSFGSLMSPMYSMSMALPMASSSMQMNYMFATAGLAAPQLQSFIPSGYFSSSKASAVAPMPSALPGKPQPLWLSAAAAVALGGVVSNDHIQHQQRMEKTARNYYFVPGGIPQSQWSAYPVYESLADRIGIDVSAAPQPLWLADPIVEEDSIDRFDYDANRRYTTVLPARRLSPGLPGPPPSYSFALTTTPSPHRFDYQPSSDVVEESEQHSPDTLDADITEQHTPDSPHAGVTNEKKIGEDNKTTEKQDNQTNKTTGKDDGKVENDKVTKANDTKNMTPEEKMKSYGLEAYPWLMQYLEAKEDAFSVQLPSKSTLKYKLKHKSQCYPEAEEKPCANSIGGGLGVCQYLTSCKDLNNGFKDLDTYLNYFCDANGFAGICCKVEAP